MSVYFKPKFFDFSIITYFTTDNMITTEPLNIENAHIWFPPTKAELAEPNLLAIPKKSILKKK